MKEARRSVRIRFAHVAADGLVVTASPQNIVLKKDGTKSVHRVWVDVFRGAARIPYEGSGTGKEWHKCSVLGGSTSAEVAPGVRWRFGVTGVRFWYEFIYSGETDAEGAVDFTVTLNGGETRDLAVTFTTVADGADGGGKGDQGKAGVPSLPPRLWEEYPSGYVFQDGKGNSEWIDVVLKADGARPGKYIAYTCLVSHPKTPGSGPVDGKSTPFWRMQDGSFSLVATELLLAQQSYIRNLIAGHLVMYDAAGENIVFEAKDGNVMARTGTFENVVMSGLMWKRRTVVTQANFGTYFRKRAAPLDFYYDIDFRKCGTWLDIRWLPSGGVGVYPTGMRSLAGNTLLIYNRSGETLTITGPCMHRLYPNSTATPIVSGGRYVTLECRMGTTSTNSGTVGKEKPYFAFEMGTIDTSLDSEGD